MFHPLIYLSALSALSLLAGADEEALSLDYSSVVDISICPIVFYGQKYEQLYVNFTSDKFVICFNDFYDPQTGGDCLVGPPCTEGSVSFYTGPPSLADEIQVQQSLPTINTQRQCSITVYGMLNNSNVVLELYNFGSQAVAYMDIFDYGSVEFDVQVSGNSVGAVVAFTPTDISGCRHSGVVYKPGTVVSSDAENCSTLICDETAVLYTVDLCQGNDTSEMQYNETTDSNNCTWATEFCNLLKEAPFTICNSLIDPQPYITACINSSCSYFAVEELNCQFLEAYATDCDLQRNSILEGWRSKVGCFITDEAD